MATDLLGGLVGVLDVVNRAAHPDEVASALVAHLGDVFGVRSAAVFGARPPHLVMIGQAGFPEDEVEGLQRLNLSDDLPLPRAYAEGEPIIDDIQLLERNYERASFPSTRWRITRDRIAEGSCVCMPILCQGRAVGAYSLMCAGKSEWSTLELAALNAIGDALGLWLTHPDSGMTTESTRGLALSLTGRQVAILAMVADNRSNTAIAASLGLSESTIKQELRRIMRALDCDDRFTAVKVARELGALEGRTA